MTEWRLVVQHLAIAVGGAIVVMSGFAVAGARPRPAWFAAAALAVGLASVAVRVLGSLTVQTDWPDVYDGHPVAWWNSDSRAQFLATWVQEAQRDPASFARVRALLAEVAAARIRPDPLSAEAVGPDLWALLTRDGRASAEEIEKAVAALENLNRDR